MSAGRDWQIQEAKSKFSALIRDAHDNPQTITKHGEPVAVVLSAQHYARLSQPPRRVLEILQSAPLRELVIERDRSDVGRATDL